MFVDISRYFDSLPTGCSPYNAIDVASDKRESKRGRVDMSISDERTVAQREYDFKLEHISETIQFWLRSEGERRCIPARRTIGFKLRTASKEIALFPTQVCNVLFWQMDCVVDLNISP